MEKSEKEKYIAAALIGAIVLIVLREIIDKKTKTSGDYVATGLFGGAIGIGLYALSKKKAEENAEPEPAPTDSYAPDPATLTASINNDLIIRDSVKHLNKGNLLYANDFESWFFDKPSQKVVVATNVIKHQRNLVRKGFELSNKYAYSSANCYCKSLNQMIAAKEGVIYIDFSASICAGLAVANVKADNGFGIGFDFYGNVAFYGNKGALASFLEHKVSTYDSSKQLWTIIFSAAVGTGASANYCPYMKDVRDLFGLSYTAEVGVGTLSIRINYDNLENITGFGIGANKAWAVGGFSYTDSRNKGLIISADEFTKLFSPKITKNAICYGNFYYDIDKKSNLVLLMRNYKYVTNITIMKIEKEKDYIISVAANDNYTKK